MVTKTERIILYGIKWIIEREKFTPELRKQMDNDICNKIIDHISPKKLKEPCCEMPEEEKGISFIGKDPGKRKVANDRNEGEGK